jgi:uncharacterized C2H2 Zn-finger protein
MFSNDDDSSNQSETDSMNLEKCPHCDKTFGDQHSWNRFNRDKHISAHFGKKSPKTTYY